MAKDIQEPSEKPLPVRSDQTIVDQLIAANHNLHDQLTKLQLTNEQLQETNLSLKNSRQELANHNAKLTRVNEDLDNFFYAVSHDLLGPMGNIEASLSGIGRRSADADFKLYLQVIESSIKKIRALIKNLATIAKLESDTTEEMVDLNELIANANWSVHDELQLAEAAIFTDLEVDKILFSKKNLKSILYHLISNAIKFRSSTLPVIKITTKKEGDHILLVVQDNGKGIPPVTLEKIFKVYGRLNRDVERGAIGLYLAKKLINAAGGLIEVESEEGKGSKFTISFPDKPLGTPRN